MIPTVAKKVLLGSESVSRETMSASTTVLLRFVTIWALISAIFGSSNDDSSSAKTGTIDCGVYLAPSSIPNAGLGMFNGNRSLKYGDLVTDEDILVPIVERKFHRPEWLANEKFLWNEYYWLSTHFGEATQGEVEMEMASPGIGAAANSYLSLVNIEDSGDVRIDRAGVSSESPGQGAFTIYHGRSFFVTDEMEPGQEIFVEYVVYQMETIWYLFG